MKVKELDVYAGVKKPIEERKKDAMNWYLIALKMSIRFLKQYLLENKFEEFFECEKQIASYCEKFRRTAGAIKNDQIQKIVKDEIENAFAVFDELPSID